MRHIELAEQFGKHFGVVVVVVDMREETAIGCRHGGPVDTVHPLVVEAGTFLYRHIVEHRLAFGGKVDFLSGGCGNGLELISLGVELLNFVAEHKYTLSLLVELKHRGAFAAKLAHEFRLALAQRHFPEVVAVVE